MAKQISKQIAIMHAKICVQDRLTRFESDLKKAEELKLPTLTHEYSEIVNALRQTYDILSTMQDEVTQ